MIRKFLIFAQKITMKLLLVSFFLTINLLSQTVAGSASDLVIERAGSVNSRKGCREVLTCTVVGDEEPTWMRGGNAVPRELIRVTNSTSEGGVIEWRSSVILDPVSSKDRNQYQCQHGVSAWSTVLLVESELVGITVRDTSTSHLDYGADFNISCAVETCIPDIVIQLFTGDQLVESTTVQERTTLVAYAHLKATEEVVGTYVCQAMSEYENVVYRQSFTVTGTPQRSRDNF